MLIPQTVLDCRGSDSLLGVAVIPEIRDKASANFCAHASQTVMVTPLDLKRDGHLFHLRRTQTL